MNNQVLTGFSLFLLLCTIGCQKGVTVHGIVTFSDGKPLEKGLVCFQSEKIVARGEIGPNGTYRLSTNASRDGVPEGNYKVYIADAFDKQVFPLPANDSGPIQYPIETPLIDSKLFDPATSGITCQVTKGMKRFDITVQPPTIQPPQE